LIKELRRKYNSEFTVGKYNDFIDDINSGFGHKIEFKIAETPIYLPNDFKNELLKASREVLDYLCSHEFASSSINAVPPSLNVPNESPHPEMLALDFAVCRNTNGELIPQLIELQAFPSLYCYQEMLNMKYRQHFDIPENVTNLFNGFEHESYLRLLREIIVGDSDPENAILLEIEPDKQKTKIDFSCTEKWIGIKTLCITDVLKEEKKLFYAADGKKIQIKRIYNRVIFDELQKRKDLSAAGGLAFNFNDELDVKWIPHPNWFFRISKHTLPALKSKYVPRTYFLDQMESLPDDLENYVLKPLFSFAGGGVKYDVDENVVNSIHDKHQYILQKKIDYAPVIETPDEPAKAEIRLLYLWREEPILVNNLVRLSKGKMMGVDYNKDKDWVGSSIAYHFA
jgi:hypothetical protein